MKERLLKIMAIAAANGQAPLWGQKPSTVLRTSTSLMGHRRGGGTFYRAVRGNDGVIGHPRAELCTLSICLRGKGWISDATSPPVVRAGGRLWCAGHALHHLPR